MNNQMLILGVIAFVIVLIVLLIILISKTSNKEQIKEYKPSKRANDNIPLPSSIGLFLPPKIDKFGRNESHDIARKVFEMYKFFDYRNMSIDELDKKEWHSWQISLLLVLFKYGEDYFIPNQKEVFHDFLLNSSENDIKSFMNGILKKYKNYVEINKPKDYLCKDYIWSNRDISIIFYFLANYKNYRK